MHQNNHEARINPDLFAAGRLMMRACIKRLPVSQRAAPRRAVSASTTQRLLSLAPPAGVAGWVAGLRVEAAAYPEPR